MTGTAPRSGERGATDAGSAGWQRLPAVVRSRAGIRLSLTLLSVVLVLAPLAVSIGLVVVILHRSLMTSLESQVSLRALDLAALITEDGLPAIISDAAGHDRDGATIQVLDARGAVAASTSTRAGQVPMSVLRPPVDVTQVEGLTSWPVPGEGRVPVIAARGLTYQGQQYTVLVSMSSAAQHEAVSTTGAVLTGALPFILLAAGGATWLLVGRALQPVERIRETVETITVRRLASRVPVPPADDEIHRLAETMNRMLVRLERSQGEQRRFVADASHELRSPLSSLRGGLQVIDPADPDTIAELLPILQGETERMARLVDDLLTLSKADDSAGPIAQRVEVDLDDVVAGEAARLAMTGVDVQSKLAPGRVLGDPLQLVRVVRNLADNGARAAADTVRFVVRAHDGRVQVRVEDDGPGVPEEDRKRIFKRFVRLDDARSRDRGGSGLGLAIVAEIVRAHGGWVHVETAELGGAAFVVDLPAAPDADPLDEAGADPA